MKLTREQNQFMLDILAELCGDQLGVKLTFTLEEQDESEAIE